MILRLLLSALCNAVMAILLYWCDKKTSFGRLGYRTKQLIYGLCFGALAIFSSTELGGFDIGGAILNVRDSAPLCAGLIFGGPAGIIAGVIGGVYRYAATIIGCAGAYTQLACSMSTILVGFIAAALRKYMFDDKKPTWFFGIGITAVCEVIHMLMIFLTNMQDPATAFGFVYEATLPMVICNCVAVGLALFMVSLFAQEGFGFSKKEGRRIATTFQVWLLVTILIAFTLASVFTATVQSRISESETKGNLETSITDVHNDIAEAIEGDMHIDDMDAYVGDITKNRHIGKSGYIVVCNSGFEIVTEGLPNTGKSIDSLGLPIDVNEMVEGEIFEVEIHGTEYFCTYSFIDGYYILGLIPREEAMYMNSVSVYISMFMKLVVFAILFVLVYFLVKKLVLDNLVRINSRLAEITGGNLDITVDVRSNEEFASLSDDINSTVATLKKYIAEAEARIDKELEFAKQIQYSSLPTGLPERDEFDIHADMYTAKEVGGDFYDYYMLNDSRLAFLVADVSGKGIPAAMFMMRAKATIKDLAEQGLEPDEIFTIANEKLCDNNDVSMFVTAWMGIIDLKTGVLKFANAGHNPPLVMRRGENFEYLKARSGITLAAMEGIKYRKNELLMNPGDKIYLYTDGVTEAADRQERLYGEGRLLALLNSIKDSTPDEACAAVVESVEHFADGAPQFDDITMLSLTFNAAIGEDSIRVVPDAASRKAVDNFTERIIEKLTVVPKIAGRINIIFDEIYSNIMNYSDAALLEISYRIEEGHLYLEFADNGIEYDPLSAKDPDTTLDIEERDVGGLGIFMVKKMAEDISYEYAEGWNRLRISVLL